MAKGFKTGGRIAGTLNKRTRDMLDEIASTGEDPLSYTTPTQATADRRPRRPDGSGGGVMLASWMMSSSSGGTARGPR